MSEMSGARQRPGLAAFWQALPREGRLLLSTIVFDCIGGGLVLPFTIIYLHQVRGFSLAAAGLLFGLQPLGGLLVMGPVGTLIDRFGPRRIMLATFGVVMVAEVVMAFASTEGLAAVGLFLRGMAFAATWPAMSSLVAGVVPSTSRQRYFGISFSLLNLGVGIGGIIGGLYVNVHHLLTFQVIFLVDALTFVPSLVMLLCPLRGIGAAPERRPETRRSQIGYLAVLRQPAMATIVIMTFLVGYVSYGQLNAGLPVFATTVAHVSTRGVGFAFAANTLVIVIFQWPVLSRIDGHRRTRVTVAMTGFFAAAWVAMDLARVSSGTIGATLLIVGCTSIFALGETLLQPTAPSIVNDLAPDHLRGRYNAVSTGAMSLGQVAGPIVTGVLLERGLATAYVASLIVGCVLVAILAFAVLEPRLGRTANGVPELDADPA